VLYQVLAENLETFLARERREDRHVPRFIEREFRKFLECGIPSYGFLRLQCETVPPRATRGIIPGRNS